MCGPVCSKCGMPILWIVTLNVWTHAGAGHQACEVREQSGHRLTCSPSGGPDPLKTVQFPQPITMTPGQGMKIPAPGPSGSPRA
jgi:hypothetical protein